MLIEQASLNAIEDSGLELDCALDRLIFALKQKDYDIKLAIVENDDEQVERLDAEISIIQQSVLCYPCETDYDRKTLFNFLIDYYLVNPEVSGTLPKGLIERIRGLYR